MNYFKYLLFNINKKLKLGCSLKAGRNFLGKICVHHQFGGKNFKKFNIDFFRRIEQYGYIYKIIIDYNRTAFIGGIIYENGLFSYIILAEKLYIGNKIYSGILNINNKIGYTNILKNIKLFTIINNLEKNTTKGISLIRAAGSSALLTNINKKMAVLKLKSGYNIFLPIANLINIGIVSNIHHKFNKLNKAGKSWSLGIRPTVRGVAMNPTDHPHGGGEGKKSPPKAQRSPWGWLTKGTKTVNLKKTKNKKFK